MAESKKSVETITLSKLDAAKRQLHTAIRLWFSDGDPVSVHTLVSAAHEIIHTLFKRAGLRGLLFDSASIPDEIRTEVARAITSVANFSKHARADPEATIEFAPGFNDFLLLYCVNGLWRMKMLPALEEVAIWVWLRIHNPSWFGSNVPNDPLPPHVHTTLANLPKSQFFQYFSEAWSGDAEFRRLFADILAKRVA